MKVSFKRILCESLALVLLFSSTGCGTKTTTSEYWVDEVMSGQSNQNQSSGDVSSEKNSYSSSPSYSYYYSSGNSSNQSSSSGNSSNQSSSSGNSSNQSSSSGNSSNSNNNGGSASFGMETTNLNNVKLSGGFLYDKFQLNAKTTLKYLMDKFEETQRFGVFDLKYTGQEGADSVAFDSDVGKWIEAASYQLSQGDDKVLRDKIEWVIDRIEEHQLDNGYFNSYYQRTNTKVFTNRSGHELYNAGHLIEAACAYYEYCGDTRFLNLMTKYADYIYKVFVVDKSAKFSTPGHEEIELALIKLYKVTGNKKYLDLCMYFLNTRGTENDKMTYTGDQKLQLYKVYSQSDKPVREMTQAAGHAVRATYLYAAMADAAKITKDQELLKACELIFDDIVNKKMHITGGLGQTNQGEAFSIDYDLKNENAYTETCASIGLILFAERMFNINHSSKYTDIIEKILYNGMMSGISLTGKEFFYSNPLEIDFNNRLSISNLFNQTGKVTSWYPTWQRQSIFSTSCCPCNVSRTLASISRFIYSVDNNDVYINQFAESEYNDGKIRVVMDTDFPNGGKIKVVSNGADNVFIRIPSWCEKFTLNCDYQMVNGYAKVSKANFEINFDMTPKYVMANQNVRVDANKIAVMRGPVVYCTELIDGTVPLHQLYLDTNSVPKVEKDNTFGIPTLSASVFVRKTSDALYSNFNTNFDKTQIKLIPYYGFANRGKSDMKLWMSYR